MNKPLIFISHITEEKCIANALEEMLTELFIGSFEFFVSSNPNILRAGTPWNEEIFNKLQQADAAIVVCSPQSVTREWINFEAGAVWSQGKPVIPACHSGLKINDLEFPLKSLQSVDLTNTESVKNILIVLADILNSTIPKNDITDFINKIQKYSSDNTTLFPLTNFVSDIQSINSSFIDALKKQHTKIFIDPLEADKFNTIISNLESPFKKQIKLENLGNTRMDGWGSKIKYKISVNPKLTRKLEKFDLI